MAGIQIQPRISADVLEMLDRAVVGRWSSRGQVIAWALQECLDPDGRPTAPSEEIPRQLAAIAQRMEELAVTQQQQLQLLEMLRTMQQTVTTVVDDFTKTVLENQKSKATATPAPKPRRRPGWQCVLWLVLVPWLPPVVG